MATVRALRDYNRYYDDKDMLTDAETLEAAVAGAGVDEDTVCQLCGDTVTPGTMNARNVAHTPDGVECGMCTDEGEDDRRIRAKALRDYADALWAERTVDDDGQPRTVPYASIQSLRARADEIERGKR